jgi:hypothetical protein
MYTFSDFSKQRRRGKKTLGGRTGGLEERQLTPPTLSSGVSIAPSPPMRVLTQPVGFEYALLTRQTKRREKEKEKKEKGKTPLVGTQNLRAPRARTWIHANDLDSPILQLLALVHGQHIHRGLGDRIRRAFHSAAQKPA